MSHYIFLLKFIKLFERIEKNRTIFLFHRTYKYVSSIILVSYLSTIATIPAQAQIIPDNTLGKESSQNIQQNLINGGAIRGINLFHSFSEFNVGDGQSIYFANPSGVVNILTRVTGGKPSQILGTLGVNGTANLFLMNPNGILFGKNASLDVKGSFVSTTANGIGFGQNGIFSANKSEVSSLLTINPSAFLFNQINPGAINVQSQSPAGINPSGIATTGLRVADGNSLLLVGGNINLDGGRLRAFDGNVELASISTPGTIGLNTIGNNLSLNVPNNIERADISLQNQSVISVFGVKGGNINIYGRNLDISNSFLIGGIGQELGNTNTQAGNINLNATEAINLSQGSLIDNTSSVGSKGNNGNINITAASLQMTSGAILQSSTSGQGNSGNININAKDSVSLESQVENNQFTRIISGIEPEGVGKGGDIQITTGSLFLSNVAVIASSIFGKGDGGNISINATDKVTIARDSSIFNDVEKKGVGNAGNIEIQTNSLSLADGSEINTKTFGQGNAGGIKITARDNITLDGEGRTNVLTRIISSVNTEGVGNAGNIQLTTGNLLIQNDAFISASTLGNGNAANIFINARDINIDGRLSNINSEVFFGGIGQGGNIRVDTDNLTLSNGGSLNSSTFGQGDAGKIIINANNINLYSETPGARSNIQSQALKTIGNAGDIEITTGSFSAFGIASVSTGSFEAQGDAGDITINARDIVKFASSPNIDSRNSIDSVVEITTVLGSDSTGKSGNIRINAGALILQDGVLFATSSSGKGDAGDISINTRDNVIVENINRNRLDSNINSFSFGGNGGDIDITTGSLFLRNGGGISSIVAKATGELIQANAGNIIINARDNVIIDGVSSNGRVSAITSSLIGQIAGKAGDIRIATKAFSVGNGALLDSSTSAQGNAGNIIINASDNIRLNGANNSANQNLLIGIYSTVLSTGVGKGGDIQLTTRSLSAINGAQINATTEGQGNGGNISLNASDNIIFSGTNPQGRISGVYSNSTQKGNAGDININSRELRLDNRGKITAITNSSDGGNIKLTADNFLLLRRGSSISTSAGLAQAGGNGGNITIDTPFIVALEKEDSDITANAFEGTGGNVNINSQSVFGIAARPKPTLQSDITASSELGVQGQINITQPETQPTQAIIELPGEVIDATRQIAQTCPKGINAFQQPLGQFTITGRGSLPPNPLDVITSTNTIRTLATLDQKEIDTKYQIQNTKSEIIEAQTWVQNRDGSINLIAKTHQPTTYLTSAQCS